MPHFRTLLAACLGLLFMTGTAVAQVGVVLTIEPPSTSQGFEDQIDVLSWSWGMTQSSPPRTGPGTLRVEARRGALSRQLSLWQRDRTRLPVVRLVSETRRQPFVVTMRDVIISSYQSGGARGDTAPTESISFNFTKIEFD